MFHGVKVLDVHSHVHDVTRTDMSLPPRLGLPFWSELFGLLGVGANRPLPSPLAPGKHADLPGNRDEDFKDITATLVKYMDERNIDTQIIGPHPLDFHGWLEDDMHFGSWINYQNDLAFKFVQAQPERFAGACQLPQRPHAQDTKHCLDELERCVKEYAFIAAYVSPDVNGKHDTPTMNQPYWYPLYEKCQELDIPLIVHGTDVLDPWYRTMGVRRYFEFSFLPVQSIVTTILRSNDVFERFPGLKVIVCHCGGFVERLGPAAPFRSTEQAFPNNLFYDTAAYDMDFLGLAIKQRGVPHFAFGTEAPGSGTELRPGTEYTADDMLPLFDEDPALGFLTEQDKLDIMHNTPKKIFPGLEDVAAINARAKVKAY